MTVATRDQPVERRDGRLVGEGGARGRDHHRIEDDRNVELAQAARRAPCAVAAEPIMPIFTASTPISATTDVDLLQHQLGRHRQHGVDAERVLGGDRGDRGHRVAAEHRHGLDVGLDAGAAAGIGAGDDQDPRRHGLNLRAPSRRDIVRAAAPTRDRPRRVELPPQFGQTPSSASSTQSAQKVHSNEQMQRVDAVGRQVAAAALAIGPHFEHQAAFTASQTLSTTRATSLASSPSAITRITGSVPDLRISSRPLAAEPRLAVGDRRLDARPSAAACRPRSGRS